MATESNDAMVDKLIEQGRLKTPALIKAMKTVDRAFFLPDELKADAHNDTPLRITYMEGFVHQSAPHMYAIVMEHLSVQPGHVVLNVGSGTGYLSTMLAWFAGAGGTSHGIEQYESNVAFARDHAMAALQSIKDITVPLTFFAGNIFDLDTATNIQYDRIYVGANCAPSQVSFFHPLLKEGGVLLVPSDGKMLKQTRHGDEIVSEGVLGVRFAELAQPEAGDSKFTCLTRTAYSEQQTKHKKQARVGYELTQASIDAGEVSGADVVTVIADGSGGGVYDSLYATVEGFISPLCKLLMVNGLEKFFTCFEAEEVTLENAKYLDAPSLQQLGIPLGPRMHMLALFRNEVTVTEAGASSAGSYEVMAVAPPPPTKAACTYRSVRGTCTITFVQAASGMVFCPRHCCKTEGCFKSKTSADQFCSIHNGADTSSSQAPHQIDLEIGLEKYVAGINSVRLGQPKEAALGLPDFMGVDDATIASFMMDPEGSIVREFSSNGSEKDKEHLRKVLSGTFDDGVTIDQLVEHKNAKLGKLRRHHVLALRMYTTNSFHCFNDPLRKNPPTRPHPFAASVYFASEGIKRLRAVAASQPDANVPIVFWRGMKDVSLTMEFLKKGGTEFACMSTTASEDVASKFAQSKCPLIFKFESSSFMSRGANVGFLSVYPEEKEFLYPPLTYLRSIKAEHQKIGKNGVMALVATVEPIFP